MGNSCGRKDPMKIFIQGLDAAGKTTLLYRMVLGKAVTTIPTIGFNVETVTIGNADITCWDIGGGDKIKPLIRHYYQGVKGCIFIIDCNDKERLKEALELLYMYTLSPYELVDAVVMVMANKQDMEGALSAQEIEDTLMKLYPVFLRSTQTVFIMPCTATEGTGVYEAFQYFVQQLYLKAAGKAKCGLITLQELRDDAKTNAESGWEHLLKNPVGYFKSFFY